jgi:hypothetical protein
MSMQFEIEMGYEAQLICRRNWSVLGIVALKFQTLFLIGRCYIETENYYIETLFPKQLR